MVERLAVNENVAGSSPASGAIQNVRPLWSGFLYEFADCELNRRFGHRSLPAEVYFEDRQRCALIRPPEPQNP